jgi:signal peptidase
VAARSRRSRSRTPTERPLRSRLRRALGWLELAAVAGVAVFWFLFLRPQALGGPASYALVNGDSMLPHYRTGDVVIVHRRDRYKVGDVIAYKVPSDDVGSGAQVIHRIIGGNGRDGFVVQGDNREAPDVWHPRQEDVVGSEWLHIPRVGVLVELLHTPLFLAGAAGLIAMLFVLTSGRRREEPKEEEAPPVSSPAPAREWTPPEPSIWRWPFEGGRGGPAAGYAEFELAPAYREKAPSVAEGEAPPPIDFAALERELHAAVRRNEDVERTLRELVGAVGEYGEHLRSHTAVMRNLAVSTDELRRAAAELRALVETLARRSEPS